MSNKGSDFYEKVYAVVKNIPQGRVTTYGHIANHIGAPQSARLVGYALNNSHDKFDIPAHRVVNRNGMLTGKHHFATPDLMEKLLKQEGLEVKNNQIENFKKYLWIPQNNIID